MVVLAWLSPGISHAFALLMVGADVDFVAVDIRRYLNVGKRMGIGASVQGTIAHQVARADPHLTASGGGRQDRGRHPGRGWGKAGRRRCRHASVVRRHITRIAATVTPPCRGGCGGGPRSLLWLGWLTEVWWQVVVRALKGGARGLQEGLADRDLPRTGLQPMLRRGMRELAIRKVALIGEELAADLKLGGGPRLDPLGRVEREGGGGAQKVARQGVGWRLAAVDQGIN